MSIKLSEFAIDEKRVLLDKVRHKYDEFVVSGLKLDMSRGKPSSEKLDLSMPMLDTLSSSSDCMTEDGFDCRNYGLLCGIPEARRLMGDMLERNASEIIVGGGSSLNLMYDTIMRAFLFGLVGSTKPWCKEEKVIFLCPSPGYDRHFMICRQFGIEMIAIDMDENGPNMDMVEDLVNNNPCVKGIWCVPKYSNPTGVTYSDEVVMRFARLTPAASDFRIFWDNAYIVHDLYDEGDRLLSLNELLKKNGKENMLLEFISTSKISFAGSGITAIGASLENIALIEKQMSVQTIGYDKITQLMHVMYLKNIDNIKMCMKKQAEILRPKFELVLDILDSELLGLGIAEWTRPKGGYFISFDVTGCAKRIVELCEKAGVKLTPAGATYPYGKDPKDSNIRIAPTYPSLNELRLATELLCIATKLAVLERELDILSM